MCSEVTSKQYDKNALFCFQHGHVAYFYLSLGFTILFDASKLVMFCCYVQVNKNQGKTILLCKNTISKSCLKYQVFLSNVKE